MLEYDENVMAEVDKQAELVGTKDKSNKTEEYGDFKMINLKKLLTQYLMQDKQAQATFKESLS